MKKLLVLALVVLAAWVYWLNRPTAETKAPEKPPVTAPKPVVYETKDWPMAKQRSQDFGQILAAMGQGASTEPALDFYGKAADLYRFGAAHEPTRYAILSANALELVWYYPPDFETEATKQAAIDLAKRAYQAVSLAGGQAGAWVVDQALQGKVVKQHKLGALTVAYAGCRDYRCQVVLVK